MLPWEEVLRRRRAAASVRASRWGGQTSPVPPSLGYSLSATAPVYPFSGLGFTAESTARRGESGASERGAPLQGLSDGKRPDSGRRGARVRRRRRVRLRRDGPPAEDRAERPRGGSGAPGPASGPPGPPPARPPPPSHPPRPFPP